MQDCKTCANAIFDKLWGEYKCTVHQHRIYDVDKYVDCPSYKEKKEEHKQ